MKKGVRKKSSGRASRQVNKRKRLVYNKYTGYARQLRKPLSLALSNLYACISGENFGDERKGGRDAFYNLFMTYSIRTHTHTGAVLW